MGASNRTDETSYQKDAWQNFHFPPTTTDSHCRNIDDRPLTYVNSDLQDPQSLTPSHLLSVRRIQQVPCPFKDQEETSDPSYVDALDLRKSVDRLTQVIGHFFSQWRKEYLTSLRAFYKMTRQSNQMINKGDVVIVHDDNTPRIHWRLAVVEELIMGNDGQVRAAHIRTSTHTTTRPFAKLHPLGWKAK